MILALIVLVASLALAGVAAFSLGCFAVQGGLVGVAASVAALVFLGLTGWVAACVVDKGDWK